MRYGYGIGVLAVVILIAITVITILTNPKGATGIKPGERVPVFAAPRVYGHLKGPADTAVKYNEGGLEEVPACKLRGAGILNICELYERGPVVLALFTDKGSCASVLSTMQRVAPSFPSASFVAVAFRNEPPQLKQLVKHEHLTLPIGYDEEGALVGLYRLATCPQVSFIDKGGVEQSKALLVAPSAAELRARVAKLVVASNARAHRPARSSVDRRRG